MNVWVVGSRIRHRKSRKAMSNPISHFPGVVWFLIPPSNYLAFPASRPFRFRRLGLELVGAATPSHTPVPHHCAPLRPIPVTLPSFEWNILNVPITESRPDRLSGALTTWVHWSKRTVQCRSATMAKGTHTTHPGAATERTTKQVGELLSKVDFPLPPPVIWLLPP